MRPKAEKRRRKGRPVDCTGATPEQVAAAVLRFRAPAGDEVEAVRQPGHEPVSLAFSGR